MARMAGKTALVTGAGSGIGRSAALALAREGAAVWATDIDEHGLAITLAQSGPLIGEITTAIQDVTSEPTWSDMFDQAAAAYGPVHVLVNNAGVAIAGPIAEFSLEDWQKQMAINLDSVFLGTREGMRKMSEGGSIINISSVAGLRGAAGASAYCASKGGVRLFSKAAAIECAELQLGIRVNSVHPGIIDTPIWTKSITRMTEASLDTEGMAALMENTTGTGENAMDPNAIAQTNTPMGRAGSPDEVGALILFLASEESSFISGQEHVIDGAMTAR